MGDYANGGSEWSPEGEPERVQVHDFVDPILGKAIPYWIYDLANNEGWVSVGDPPTPPSSRSSRSGGGGTRWAGAGSPMPIA